MKKTVISAIIFTEALTEKIRKQYNKKKEVTASELVFFLRILSSFLLIMKNLYRKGAAVYEV